MIIDNVSDFTHAYLHRRFKPFTDSKLTDLRVEGDCVHVAYDTQVAAGPLMRVFVDRADQRQRDEALLPVPVPVVGHRRQN
jgi:hypothetical protein